jgi:subtilisin
MARYIMLPPRGVRADTADSVAFLADTVRSNVSTAPAVRRSFAALLSAAAPDVFDPFERTGFDGGGRRAEGDGDLRLIDALHADGAKLVELEDAAAELFGQTATLARIVPEVTYRYNAAPHLVPRAPPPGVAGALTLKAVCATTRAPLAGLTVTLLTDLAAGLGARGITDANGNAALAAGPSPVRAALLHVAAPAAGHWGLCARDRDVRDGEVLALAPVNSGFDCIAALRAPAGDDTPGAGVRIAVIDSGIGPHGDLVPHAMVNVVPGQPAADGADNGIGHGTHVGGAIAGRGTMFRGIAPGAQIFCYRVGGSPDDPPTSYSVMKALDRAAEAGCVIINLSLSTATDDIAVREAIRDVNLRGCVVVAAAGNGWRDPIEEPARFDEVIAVAAYGDSTAMPAGSDGHLYISQPAVPERPAEFVAAFSNVAGDGVGMGLIAPGVGIISLALGGGCRVMHGTSMATAIVSGQIARLLARRPDLLAMPPDHARSVAIRRLVFAEARRRGFGIKFEGFGAL